MPSYQGFDFSHLSEQQRRELAMALLDSVGENSAPLTPAQAAELDRRLAMEECGELESYSWEEVKAYLLRPRA